MNHVARRDYLAPGVFVERHYVAWANRIPQYPVKSVEFVFLNNGVFGPKLTDIILKHLD